jgi:hypothetical protein
MAVVVLDFATDKRSIDVMLAQLEEVQTRFKNAYAILLNANDSQFFAIQLRLRGGLLRFLLCFSVTDALSDLMEIYRSLKDNQKLKMQQEFFSVEERRITSKETARHIAFESFAKLGIPDSDAQLILDGFPNLKAIISAETESLSANSPADLSSIEKCANFFAAADYC